MDELARITRIASRTAKRHGVSVSVYANHIAFDVLIERKDTKNQRGGIAWVKSSTREAYLRPATTAKAIRRSIRAA